MDPRHLILLLLVLSPSVRGGGIYWSDRGSSQLKRMQFDGSDLETIPLTGAVSSPGSNVRGIAVDIVRERVYWADNGADRLLRANFDGSMSVILHTFSGNSFPADVRIGLGHEVLFWCDQARNVIARSPLDGGSFRDVITNAAPTGPYFMDLESASGKIYWGDFAGGAIYRSNLDGSERETLLTGNEDTRGVCVDRRGGMLYWVNRNAGKVHRCALSALGGRTLAITDPAVETLYENLDTPHGLVIDVPAQKLYWADTGTNAGEGQGASALSRGDLDGGTPAEVLAAGSQPWDVDLDRRCRTYDEWRRRCFRRDAPADRTDPASDPEQDGWKNAVEYAFNFSPLHIDTRGTPYALLTTIPGSEGTYPAVRYRRRAGASDLAYYVQVSDDLVGWLGDPHDPQTADIDVTPLEDDMEEVTARALDPLPEGTARFMRVAVELRATAQ